MHKWMLETCHESQIVSHPGRFTRGKSMNCLACKNQSHQSHDHRHEQYPHRDGGKGESQRLCIRTIHPSFQCIFNVITDHKTKRQLALSSNSCRSSVCHIVSHPIHHSLLFSPWYHFHSACYISIYTFISLHALLLLNALLFSLTALSLFAACVCCSAAVCEQGQWWREAQTRGAGN